jgi:predicted RNA-binding Zn-ribbon protein involved in translation (DUF1610 family)
MNADVGGPRSARGKSVLFCPECRFEGPLSEEWLVVETGEERAVVCPSCGHVAAKRSARSTRPAPRHAD